MSVQRPRPFGARDFGDTAIRYNLTNSVSAMALLLLVGVLNGCTNSEADAAEYAAEAQNLFNDKRIPEARQLISKAIASRDDVAEFHLLRGRIEYSAGAYENAYAAFSEALALSPSNPEALQAVSQIGLRVGRFDESVSATDKLLVLYPDQPDALLMRGLQALVKRDYAGAAKTADQILSLDPINEGGVVLKARATFLNGNPQAASEILANFDKARPNTQAVSLTRLEIYRALRNPVEMGKQYLALSKLRPEDLELRIDNANFLYKIGQSKQATQIVASVLADKTATEPVIKNALGLLEEYAITEMNAHHISKIAASGAATARVAAARYFVNQNNPVAATTLLAELSGTNADAERANIAVSRGDRNRASATLDNLLEADKTHCSALKAQAGLKLSNRRFAEALPPAQSAASECPERPELWILTAKIYQGMGDDFNARRVYAQGIDANKQNAALSRAYSEYLLTHKRSREAIAIARKLTRAAPALMSGWQLYTEICTKAQSSCVAEAREGLADAKTRFGVDLLPGELPPNGLFGRLVRR